MHISLIFSILSYVYRDVNAEKGKVQSAPSYRKKRKEFFFDGYFWIAIQDILRLRQNTT